MADGYKVSALVSTYDAARFLPGCLDDLESQTIADRLEIIVVDSNSSQNEEEIVRDYMTQHDNIKYIRTPRTETVYAAWNRAIEVSTGVYLTNANTDDRHRRNALELMSRTLDQNPRAGLVYGGYLITSAENETFEKNTATERFMPLDYKRELLLRGYCFPGPQPMWRRSIHEEFGLFDERLTSAGDLEFWLRISERYPFRRLDKVLGLYLLHPESAEHRDWGRSQWETAAVLSAYRQRQSGAL